METVFLNKMKKGQSGEISALPEGERAKLRLSEMGLRAGMKITVDQVMPLSGPVIIKAGQTQIAIGHGMASRIKINLG